MATTLTTLKPLNLNTTDSYTFGNASITGNITVGNVKTDHLLYANGTAWTFSSYSNTDVAAYLPTYSGNFTAGNANITGILTVGTFTTSGTSGNITGANYVVANFFSGDGSLLDNIVAGNIDGQVSNALVAGTVYTNAQPNITSLGTLIDLEVTGNVTASYLIGNGSQLTGLPASYANANVEAYLPTYTGNLSPSNLVVSTSANLGAVGNVIITGGSANYVLTTDGAGTLSWAAQSGGGSSTSTTISVDNFTGNGVADTYTLSVTPTSVNSVFVNYNGAFVGRGSYSLNGANLTFGSIPANGASIEVTTIEGLTIGSGAFTTRTYTGDGSETAYTVSSGTTDSSVLVTLDGVLQTPTVDYIIDGVTLTFTDAPYNGAAIQIRELAVASSSGGTGGASRAVAMTMGIIFGG